MTIPALPQRIQTATRQVVLFGRLEDELNEAAAARNREKLSSLLADDFEQRTPAPPMDPVPRQQWMDQALNGHLSALAKISHMAVRTFSETCVVDFREQSDPPGKKPDRFVVDVWRGSEQGWKLAVRYVSEVQPTGASSKRKPMGKE